MGMVPSRIKLRFSKKCLVEDNKDNSSLRRKVITVKDLVKMRAIQLEDQLGESQVLSSLELMQPRITRCHNINSRTSISTITTTSIRIR